MTVRLGLCIEERDRLLADNKALRTALEAALASHRESWAHPGTGRHDPYKLPDPEWVTQARTALAKARD